MSENTCENNLIQRVDKLLNTPGYVRTGCTLLDCAMGGGNGLGVPFGKVINIVGDSSSGKTALVNEVIAKNYHTQKDFFWNYDDSESGHTFDTNLLYGFDIITPETITSSTVEELDVNLYNFINKNKKGVGIYVVDSLDGLSNEEINEREKKRANAYNAGKEFKDGTYGMKTPKHLSQEFFRTKTNKIQDKQILLVFVSQVRQNIDPFSFKKFTRSGGKALDFYCHSVVWLANITKIKKSEHTVGAVIKAKLDKSKTSRPYRECTFTFYFDYGIDNIGSNLDFLFDLRGKDGKLTKAAEQISWNGIEKNLKNYKEFLTKLELYDKIKEDKKQESGKATLNIDYIEEWVARHEDVKKMALEHFGETSTRDELIQKAENDKEFELEIEKRTILKWEIIEESLKTNRRGKYAK